MSKRNVTYIKQEEPSFLKKLKLESGFKEGPTVDTKREKLPELNDNDEERLDEQPVVVVLKSGDLSAQEAENEKKRIKAEEELRAADLNQRIIFCPSVKSSSESNSQKLNPAATEKKTKIERNRNSLKNKDTPELKNKLLSFNEDEEDEEY